MFGDEREELQIIQLCCGGFVLLLVGVFATLVHLRKRPDSQEAEDFDDKREKTEEP